MRQLDKARALVTVQDLYRRAYHRGKFKKMRAMLTRCQRHLFELGTVQSSFTLHSLQDTETRIVPIRQIRGTVNRPRDFDIDFNPLQTHNQERWQEVAMAVTKGKILAPVMLFQIVDTYFVQDGHHRVSIARLLDQTGIDAVVTRLKLGEPLSQGQLNLANCLQTCPLSER